MTIEWNGKNREEFRLILQQVYTDYDELEIFVSEKLDKNLSEIAEKEKLDKVVFKLLKWAALPHNPGLDYLLSKFCEANDNIRTSVLTKLKPLISLSIKVPKADWENLFGLFAQNDFAYMQIAFREAFKVVHDKNFFEIRPDYPPMNSSGDIQCLLIRYDNPILAVRFVECAIAQFQLSSEVENRDLSALKVWRDRITEQFQVPPVAPIPDQTVKRHAYLLVTLEESGSDVNVYPELHITDTENPIGFGAKPTTCSMNQVADQISEWIFQAEYLLESDICDDAEVTLEVFLPCKYLEEDIAITWSVKDKRGDPIALGIHRRFVVRSSDRIRDRQIQKALQGRWAELQTSVQKNNACEKFHLQTACPETKGILCAALKDNGSLGLKFLAPLPTDARERIDLYNDIIDAAIPIALWSSEMVDLDAVRLKAEFESLLQQCQLNNFTDLAKQWRMQRSASPYIKLLCDRPDRLPRLPDLRNREDDDAIVAC